MIRRPPTAISLHASDLADVQTAMEARSNSQSAPAPPAAEEPNGTDEGNKADVLMKRETAERGNRERMTQAERIGI